MSQPDFNDFADDILVKCADMQTGDRVLPCDVRELCKATYADCPPTWAGMIFERLTDQGFGKSTMDSNRPGARLFKINASGVARAAEVRRIRTEGEAGSHVFPIPQKPSKRLAAFFGVSNFLFNVLIGLAALATIVGLVIVLSDKGWL